MVEAVLDAVNYLYDGWNVLEEVDNAGSVLARYTQRREVDEPLAELRSGTASYYEADAPGTITSLSNGAGGWPTQARLWLEWGFQTPETTNAPAALCHLSRADVPALPNVVPAPGNARRLPYQAS